MIIIIQLVYPRATTYAHVNRPDLILIPGAPRRSVIDGSARRGFAPERPELDRRPAQRGRDAEQQQCP